MILDGELDGNFDEQIWTVVRVSESMWEFRSFSRPLFRCKEEFLHSALRLKGNARAIGSIMIMHEQQLGTFHDAQRAEQWNLVKYADFCFVLMQFCVILCTCVHVYTCFYLVWPCAVVDSVWSVWLFYSRSEVCFVAGQRLGMRSRSCATWLWTHSLKLQRSGNGSRQLRNPRLWRTRSRTALKGHRWRQWRP